MIANKEPIGVLYVESLVEYTRLTDNKEALATGLREIADYLDEMEVGGLGLVLQGFVVEDEIEDGEIRIGVFFT